jgi:hypothetical protein
LGCEYQVYLPREYITYNLLRQQSHLITLLHIDVLAAFTSRGLGTWNDRKVSFASR